MCFMEREARARDECYLWRREREEPVCYLQSVCKESECVICRKRVVIVTVERDNSLEMSMCAEVRDM